MKSIIRILTSFTLSAILIISYSSFISHADATTPNNVNTKDQACASTNEIYFGGVPVPVSVSNPNANAGYIPSVNFFQGGTDVVYKSFYGTGGTMYVPAGTYNVVITQTNYKPFSATISGYGTQTGSTVTFNNVIIQGNYFQGQITINN